MATAYVSPTGSAAYPGTVGAPTSLSTALSSAGAGDIVYLAPGSYRGTFTLGVSGTAGNTIQFIGDPLATQNIGGIAAGIVRVTNYLVDNANPTNAVLFTAISQSYWSFSNIYFDAYRNGSTIYAFTLTTCTNWSFDKCAIVSVRSRGAIITTAANVALNASFTKCVFNIVASGYALDLNMPNHSGNYNVNFSLTECISSGSIIQSFNGSPGTSTNAGGITIYNCYSSSGTCVQLYQSNTTHPAYVYNSILNSSGNAIISSVTDAVIENYNVVIGSTFSVTAGANSFYAGAIGLDYGYSAIVGLPAPSVNGPYLGSRLLGAGTATGAPSTDADGVTWYQSLLGMGAYTYAARNNVIGFINQPATNTITIAPGSTSQSIELYLGATGLTASTSGLSARYNRTRTASVSIPLVARTIAQAWTAGGFAEVDATNMPGIYRLDLPDAALAAGADDVTVVVRGASGTNGAVMTVKLSSGGLTEAQTASAVLDAVSSSYVTAGSIGYAIQNGNVASISGSTAAADELEGALLHNGTDYISAELVTPVTSAALVRMGPFEVKADGLGASDPLDIQKGAQHGIDIQCVDNNGAGIDITSATVTAKVYNSGATLVDTYSCTATYAADGRATFTIDTTVTDTPGTYTATITRTTGASDTQVFGPLRIYVRDI
jgi:hypothetical protein